MARANGIYYTATIPWQNGLRTTVYACKRRIFPNKDKIKARRRDNSLSSISYWSYLLESLRLQSLRPRLFYPYCSYIQTWHPDSNSETEVFPDLEGRYCQRTGDRRDMKDARAIFKLMKRLYKEQQNSLS